MTDSDLMAGFFDIGRSSADSDSVALPLTGDAVLVREMDLGAGGLHDFGDGPSRTTDQVRVIRIVYFHTQRSHRVL